MIDCRNLRMLVLIDIPEAACERIQALAPGMRVDQMKRNDSGYDEALAEADIIAGWFKAEDLPRAKKLRWLQTASAGANHYLQHLPEDVVLTNASGLYGVQIAEHVFALMLALSRGIPAAVRAASERRWAPPKMLGELSGSVCGILGLGDLGSAVAIRAKAFGLHVIAVKRAPGTPPPYVDELYDVNGLDAVLARADHVVVTLPGTPHTKHLLDARRLGLMKQGACIYNIGRGSVIDEAALVELLQAGHLAGAGLDVFEQEPLPTDSPLWTMPNVIITPHCAGLTPRHNERFAELLIRNLERFLAGQPLENVVDRYWGY